MVFYEAPHKLPATLRDMAETLGDRRVALVREITKIHEEVIRTTLKKAAERFASEAPRGEFVLVIEGAAPAEAPAVTLEEAAALAADYAAEGLPASEAARRAAAETGCKKGEIYRLLTVQNSR